MSTGTILHVNVVGFMAALEEILDTTLRGRPFVIANRAASRAVVLDISREAHREGVRRGMLLAQAARVLTGLVVREPRVDLYASANQALGRICQCYSPCVEIAGSGHVFMELAGTSGLNGSPEDVSQKIRRAIFSQTGLRPVLALSGSKTVSKVATRVFRPAGFIALSPWEEDQLMLHQPVSFLPGVGVILSQRLNLLGIREIGDLAKLSNAEARALGPRGPELAARARGVDYLPVDPEPPERRTERGAIVFEPDVVDPELIRPRLELLASKLAYSLRRQGLGARRVHVQLFYTDGLSGSAYTKSSNILVRDDEIVHLACESFFRARTRRVRVRRISVELSSLSPAGPELDLFEPTETRLALLQSALDKVRTRYGFPTVFRATILIGNRAGSTGSDIECSFVPVTSETRVCQIPDEASFRHHNLAVG